MRKFVFDIFHAHIVGNGNLFISLIMVFKESIQHAKIKRKEKNLFFSSLSNFRWIGSKVENFSKLMPMLGMFVRRNLLRFADKNYIVLCIYIYARTNNEHQHIVWHEFIHFHSSLLRWIIIGEKKIFNGNKQMKEENRFVSNIKNSINSFYSTNFIANFKT